MLVAISQRSSCDHGGVDALEVTYNKYFSKFGVTLIPIPNDSQITRQYFSQLNIEGVILSGGGDISPSLYGDESSVSGSYSVEREKTEKILLEIAIEQNLPVLGICRGMEFLNVSFGGKLLSDISKNINNGLIHDESRHNITLAEDVIIKALGTDIVDVNSFHRLGIRDKQLSKQLIPFARASDLSIEALYHPKLAIGAIMWHPEREESPNKLNQLLVKAFISKELFWKISI